MQKSTPKMIDSNPFFKENPADSLIQVAAEKRPRPRSLNQPFLTPDVYCSDSIYLAVVGTRSTQVAD